MENKNGSKSDETPKENKLKTPPFQDEIDVNSESSSTKSDKENNGKSESSSINSEFDKESSTKGDRDKTISKSDKSKNYKKGRQISIEEVKLSPSDSSFRRSDGSIFSSRSESSEETMKRLWAPLYKGHEQYNITKQGGSSRRPVSPPPTKLLSKANKLRAKEIKQEGSEVDKKEEAYKSSAASDKDKKTLPSHPPPPPPPVQENLFPPKLILEYSLLYDEDDNEDEDIIVYNPSGSVLAPAVNPYNKQERIRQANIALFQDKTKGSSHRSRIKFNDIAYLFDDEINESSDTVLSMETSDLDGGKETSSTHRTNENTEKLKDDKKKTEDRGYDAKNGIPNGLKVKGINPKKLLVLVPNTNNDLISLHSDQSSSSENEDVCVGLSVITRISNKNDETTLDETPSKEQNLENNTNKDEENEVKNFIDGAGDGIDPGELDTDQNLITSIESSIFCDNNGGGDACFGPNNNTGIQIKITCPNCSDVLNCVEFCSTEDNEKNYCSSNYENSTQRPHNCNQELTKDDSLIKNNISTVYNEKNHRKIKKLDSSIYLKNNFQKSDNTFLRSNSTIAKNSTNNISINLNMKSNYNNHLKTKFSVKTKCSKEKRKSYSFIKPNKKISADLESTSSEEFSKKKKNQQINKNSTLNTNLLNDKENKNQFIIGETFTKSNNFKSLDKLKNSSSEKKQVFKSDKQKRRPKSCPEHHNKYRYAIKRPLTAPESTKRGCCNFDTSRLPEYNGFRSEYGLSAEQLQERKRMMMKEDFLTINFTVSKTNEKVSLAHQLNKNFQLQ